MNINLVFDPSAATMPSGMVSAIEYAANFYDQWLTNPITVNILVEFGQVAGVPLTTSGAEGRFNFIQTSYSSLLPVLAAQDGGAQLPTVDPSGGAGIYVPDAEAKSLGLISGTATGIDGYIGFLSEPYYATDPNNRAQPDMLDFTGIALHEISLALGRRADGLSPVGAITVANLFRYAAPGVLGVNGAPSYFSIDGGSTNLGNFYSLGQDYLDWDYKTTGLDAFRGGITPDTVSPITPRDAAQMAALGYTESSITNGGVGLPFVIQTNTNSFGSITLTGAGNSYFLCQNGVGPPLRYHGADAAAGGFGSWAPIGAVRTATGYDVAWHDPAANTYGIWSTDNNGNFSATLATNLNATSLTLEQYELVFNQDINGDGTVGPPTVVIQTDTSAYGTTSLTQVGNTYFLYDNGSGPSLKFNGADATAGEFGTWAPIGAVRTATGYDVAWHDPVANTYGIWSTDNNGNFSAILATNLNATSLTLEQYELVFNQDINGDGTVGPPIIVIQTDTSAYGTTSLTQVGNTYFLYDNGSGPSLKFNGADATAGDFGNWEPIGAVRTATGYDIAWHDPAVNTYGIWSTDNNGNFSAILATNLNATSLTLEQYELVFNQDINHDGVIGIVAAPATKMQIAESFTSPTGSTTIGAGASLELRAADSASVTFQGSTGLLRLDDASNFSGDIVGFRGDGSLSGSDQIDLPNFKFSSLHDSFSTRVLSVTDGTNSANLNFVGPYNLANFAFAADAHGGTIVFDPPARTSQLGDGFALARPVGVDTILDFDSKANTTGSHTELHNLSLSMAGTDPRTNVYIELEHGDGIIAPDMAASHLLAHLHTFSHLL